MNDCWGAWVRQAAEEGAACPGNGARSPTSTLETQLCYDEAWSETSAKIYAIKWMSNLALLEKPTLEAPCVCSRMGEAIAGTGLVHGPPRPCTPCPCKWRTLIRLRSFPLPSKTAFVVNAPVRGTPASALLALFGLQTQNPSLPACPNSDTALCHNNTPYVYVALCPLQSSCASFPITSTVIFKDGH